MDVDKGDPNLALLAQAAKIEHALTPLQAIRKHWRAFLWCNFMCVGALLWGYDMQVGRELWGGLASWQSSVGSIGSVFGGLSSGWISDRLGRRSAVAIACVISTVGVLIQLVISSSRNGILVGKLVNGFALGIFVSCASGYCVEVSPLALRGITTASVNLWIVLGRFMPSGVIHGSGHPIHAYAYRLPLTFQWLFPILLLIGISFAPESPWWLVGKGRYAAAERALAHLGGPTVDVTFQRQRIQETLELEDSYTATSTYMDCFRGQNLRRTVVAMMMFVLQQSAGVVFVSWISAYSFKLAGFSDSIFFYYAVGVTAIEMIGNLLVFWIVDRSGRRFLFYWGVTACVVCLFSMGLALIRMTNISVAKFTVFAFTIIYSFFYQASIGPLAHVLSVEVPSAKLRSKTIGIAICTNSLCRIFVGFSVSLIIDLGLYAISIVGWLAFAGRVWGEYFIPETTKRTVDELDLLYKKRIPPRNFASCHRLYEEVELEQW